MTTHPPHLVHNVFEWPHSSTITYVLLLIWFLSELTAVSKSQYSSHQTNSCFSRFIVFSHHSVFYRKELRPPGLHLNKCPPLHTGLLNDTRFNHRRQLIWSQIRWFNLNEHCCALHVLLFLATFMPPKFIWPLFKYSKVFLSPWNSRLHKYLKNFLSVCYDK